MTNEILIGSNPDKPEVVGAVSFTASNEEKARQVPIPSGYRVLCAVPEVEEQYDSGLVKADQTINFEEKLATVLFVVEMGPDCYKDPARFPTGPWCKKGDWVMIGRYAGARFRIDGGEVRIINDDEVIATIMDPADVLHV